MARLKRMLLKPKNILLLILVIIIAMIITSIFPLNGKINKINTKESNEVYFEKGVTVIDGDTIKVGKNSLRIWGIDAPELKQKCTKDSIEFDCGIIAKKLLTQIVLNDPIKCNIIDIDKYQRKIVQCTAINNFDIGLMMVQLGWALDYEEYSNGFYKTTQQDAINEKRGLWSTSFIKPWEWRREHHNHKNRAH